MNNDTTRSPDSQPADKHCDTCFKHVVHCDCPQPSPALSDKQKAEREAIAYLYEWIGDDYTCRKKGDLIARTVIELGGNIDLHPEKWKRLTPLFAAPQAKSALSGDTLEAGVTRMISGVDGLESLTTYESPHGTLIRLADAKCVVASAARRATAGTTARCPHCDDTGDVHDQTGEWRGTCTCPAGTTAPEYESARALAFSIWRDNYKGTAPEWKPLDDLAGVISQIDNMASGMKRVAGTTAAPSSDPGQAAFEAQACYQGATNFTLVHPDFLVCNNGWTPATYRDPMTELAWRVWANKPKVATADNAAPIYQIYDRERDAWDDYVKEDFDNTPADQRRIVYLAGNAAPTDEGACAAALRKIIEMNRQHAQDQYGDANKAESWSCIVVARKALAGSAAAPGDLPPPRQASEYVDEFGPTAPCYSPEDVRSIHRQ